MYQAVFIACLTQGLLPGLAVLVLLAAALRLQKQYGPQCFCRLWTKLAVLTLTACCAGSMVACKTVEPLPEEPTTAASAPSETGNPIVTPEPPPVSVEAGATAVRRGADFLWSEYLTNGNGYYYHSARAAL